ncbi:unnamed protein product [Fusarium graminearum]|uniref:Chromosome 1, complete genome n=2 Tax=Gibberella zeae TaxID=5518 RepID=A0A098D8H8_GIBZE|nr:unnamed protein product [Fusarium graminearum]CAF3568263.1 unnamed protein product [Fusarium graminearum]CAF3647669.1 unnamed protein product [Fusarium graminearum]CAG1960581.1 unnamed protein product [Fusarium graminearum]CAG1967837.1 unnamed protein product [Fusarium graminearum]
MGTDGTDDDRSSASTMRFQSWSAAVLAAFRLFVPALEICQPVLYPASPPLRLWDEDKGRVTRV